jgi:coatomer subunit beta'
LTSSDDATIKMWDFEKGFSLARVFEGHSHYVMKVCFNPRDTNIFASASLDKTIKVTKKFVFLEGINQFQFKLRCGVS